LIKFKKIDLTGLKVVIIDEADFFFERSEDRTNMKKLYESLTTTDP